MSVQKNPLLAVEALANIADKEWSADFVGDGPLLESVRKFAKDRGLTSRITFHGWMDGKRVRQILGKADILFMTSLSEGLPMVGVEALAAGLAIVSTGIDGMLDVVEEGRNGFLVPVDSGSTGLGDALSTLLENRDLLATMRHYSAKKVTEFDVEKTVTCYESALFKIL